MVEIGDKIYDYTLNADPQKISEKSVGTVSSVKDGIARVEGLSGVMAGELVQFSSGATGLALNLEEKSVGVILVDGQESVLPNEQVSTTGQILSIPVSNDLLGRIVSPLGMPVDDGLPLESETLFPLERIAPGVTERKSVTRPLLTGVTAIDSMIPIGRGQRELIIGDRQTGKSSIALTTIINQTDVISIYVAIGQKRSSIARTASIFAESGALARTIIVAASASDSAAFQYLAPYAGCAIAEYFLNQGKDVLIVYDDLTKHAWAYRQISLLLGRPSGREAYPGDIFYAHSRLLERAVQLDDKHGGGSITALPIIETLEGDVSSYIPTNVISITDGQIYLLSELFNSGQRPAIDVGNSVSRVGSSAQLKAMKQVAGRLRIDLAQYQELEAFAQFASDLDEKTRTQLSRGKRLYELLKQGWDEPLTFPEQVVLLWSGINGVIDSIDETDVIKYKEMLIEQLRFSGSSLIKKIETKQALDEDLEKLIAEFTNNIAMLFVKEQEEKNGR
ncbi:F0F1 ATP synthase subunit alpha [Candidatus Woesebacteria bacterium RIFCSPHIGHO2_01_FULL_41_10]|uniref:ATP synthase subunit alpha n=1 Tax=Candidatus Woesebacteria bacterium RIFCSPHIGHO2_01_FULL_41_10 TaxID=1802500 RepID=A0A1F7YQS1_9BACT|nr:MAG: F0F1 ATP synthase subunit alpha [Candidatus Woesebacteria bacterium RIFCSPHIGHO2_01_FULL_41_10]